MTKKTVLVVDDNVLNLKLASDVLEFDGYGVLRASDAEQARAVLAEHHPDLILMDLAMPGMDGLTLTRLLKADPALAHIPIVALTAFAMRGDDTKALEAGCCGYITKPIDTRRLAADIEKFMTPPQPAPSEPAAPGPEPVKVLIVEDNQIDLKLMGTILRVSGHVVIGNGSAEAASMAIEQDCPDVILLDLKLPGIDGLSFVRRLKSQESTRDIPVVAVTAVPEGFHRDELLAAGCAAYLVKPVNTRDLAYHLLRAVGKEDELATNG